MTEEALIAAILDAPCDNGARLIYADWLEEHSDPRAWCLRLAARLRASYGPRHPTHSPSFWYTLGRGIEPVGWVEDVFRLAEKVQDAWAGNGSKTAVLVALALLEATLLFPESWDGSDANALQRAALPAVEAINRLAVQPRSSAEVSRCLRTVTLGDEVIAEAMLSAYAQAGRDGVIRVTSRTAGSGQKKVQVAVQQGLRFSFSDLAEAEGRELRHVAVLVSLRPLQPEELRRALSAYSQVATSLLCFCPGLDAESAELYRDAIHNGAQILLCTAPRGRWRDCYADAAVATGASAIRADEEGPVEITPERFGQAGIVRVEEGDVVINQPGGTPEGIQLWITHLHQILAEETAEQEWHSLRLAQLSGGMITVEVCGESHLETKQLEELSSKALHAGRATIARGYVPGGGVAYLRMAAACREGPATQALRWALEEPTRALLAGSALNVKDTLAVLRADDSLGLDVMRNELPPWRKTGPVDPTQVVQTVIETALQSASRLCSQFGELPRR